MTVRAVFDRSTLHVIISEWKLGSDGYLYGSNINMYKARAIISTQNTTMQRTAGDRCISWFGF